MFIWILDDASAYSSNAAFFSQSFKYHTALKFIDEKLPLTVVIT